VGAIKQLQDKVAVVTGAAGDIGSATVRRFIESGARVAGVDLAAAGLERLRGSVGSDALLTLQGSVSDESSVQDFLRETRRVFGRLDILFNNAGIEGPVRPLCDYPLAEFERVMSVNVVGVFLGMKHAIPIMLEHGGGSIINASSTAGLSGASGVCAYNASKHAVIGLTRSAAVEHAAKGIRINAIAPGPIASRMIRELEEGLMPGQAGAAHARMVSGLPAGRYGEPAEVAAVVAFLASDDARYVHGAVYTIDGGRMAR
jgi:NAD(P)-dependent dehydrogenase (short-subunit alcohol dehydrogenase family)